MMPVILVFLAFLVLVLVGIQSRMDRMTGRINRNTEAVTQRLLDQGNQTRALAQQVRDQRDQVEALRRRLDQLDPSSSSPSENTRSRTSL